MDIENLVKLLKPYSPKKIILFGSQVYGSPKKDSDFDIAIIKNTSTPFHERLIQVRRLVQSTVPIDFFVFTENEIEFSKDKNPFIQEIMEKGKIIYEQKVN